MDHAIWAEGLVKRFGETTALAGVDLVVDTGRVLGMLGPNGAGKTTAVRILATLLEPDAGRALVGGYDIIRQAHQVRQLIGLTGQYASVDETLTGAENLLLIGRLLGIPRRQAKLRAKELLADFHLEDAADRATKTYSGGMRRRLDLAASLVGRPRLLYLDEPTTGLDPRSRRELWQIVREQVADGVTVLLTTQYLDEADQLAHRVGVLDGGRIIAEGTPAQLKSRVPGGHVEVQFVDAARLTEVAAVLPEATADAESLTLRMANEGVASLRRLLDRLDDDAVAGLTVQSADLDDVFLALTGHAAETQDGAEDENEMEAVR
jgi:oleandomycin transport system ATP-binding protein